MAPSTRTILGALLIASTASALPQSPAGKIDSSMPFLTATTATSVAAVETTSSASEGYWNTWSAPQSFAPTAVTSMQSVPYSNPFTIYTTMTDSRGVITGMPQVVTSQPSQTVAATVCPGCSSVMSDQASWSSMVASLYSTSTPAAASANATMSTSTRPTASGNSSASASPSFQQSTGDASRSGVVGIGAVLALVMAVPALL